MLTPVLVVALCSSALTDAPRSAHLLSRGALLTQEQIEESPVELLTYRQLLGEEKRLADPPSVVGPAVLLGVGGGMALLGGIFGALSIDATNKTSSPLA